MTKFKVRLIKTKKFKDQKNQNKHIKNCKEQETNTSAILVVCWLLRVYYFFIQSSLKT